MKKTLIFGIALLTNGMSFGMESKGSSIAYPRLSSAPNSSVDLMAELNFLSPFNKIEESPLVEKTKDEIAITIAKGMEAQFNCLRDAIVFLSKNYGLLSRETSDFMKGTMRELEVLYKPQWDELLKDLLTNKPSEVNEYIVQTLRPMFLMYQTVPQVNAMMKKESGFTALEDENAKLKEENARNAEYAKKYLAMMQQQEEKKKIIEDRTFRL